MSNSSAGLWNGTNLSLRRCLYNCTALIPNCGFSQCNDAKLCYNCESGYFPVNTTIGTSSYAVTTNVCGLCSLHHPPQCIDCSTQIRCDRCIDGYYVKLTSYLPMTTLCEECYVVLPNCTKCNTFGNKC